MRRAWYDGRQRRSGVQLVAPIVPHQMGPTILLVNRMVMLHVVFELGCSLGVCGLDHGLDRPPGLEKAVVIYTGLGLHFLCEMDLEENLTSYTIELARFFFFKSSAQRASGGNPQAKCKLGLSQPYGGPRECNLCLLGDPTTSTFVFIGITSVTHEIVC